MINPIAVLILGAAAMFVSGAAIGYKADSPDFPVAGILFFLIGCGVFVTAIMPLVH